MASGYVELCCSVCQTDPGVKSCRPGFDDVPLGLLHQCNGLHSVAAVGAQAVVTEHSCRTGQHLLGITHLGGFIVSILLTWRNRQTQQRLSLLSLALQIFPKEHTFVMALP